MTSKHYAGQRFEREKFIEECLGGDGHIVDGFIVDRLHPNGAECHSITDKAIIIIHNLNSGVMISKLIARPQQIKRYYEHTGRNPPPEYESILELALQHQMMGYNNI